MTLFDDDGRDQSAVEQINALVESGDALGAQKLILEEVRKEFGPPPTPEPLPPAVRHGDPYTSWLAAEANPKQRKTLRHRVAGVLWAHRDGLTDWEITAALDLTERHKPSVAKRRQESGAVDTGMRRLSPDGCQCVVWRL